MTILLRSGSVTSSTRPASFASPVQSGGSADPLCKAKRGSRWRSSAFIDRHMLPSHNSPSAKFTSVPLTRGEPSRRSVARVLWTWASRKRRAKAVSSGASASTALQLGMADKHPRGQPWPVLIVDVHGAQPTMCELEVLGSPTQKTGAGTMCFRLRIHEALELDFSHLRAKGIGTWSVRSRHLEINAFEASGVSSDEVQLLGSSPHLS